MLTAQLLIHLLALLPAAPASCGPADLDAAGFGAAGFGDLVDFAATCDVLGTHGRLWITEDGAVYSVELERSLNTWDLFKAGSRTDFPQLAGDATPLATMSFEVGFRGSADLLDVWSRDGEEWILVDTLAPGEDHTATFKLDVGKPYWLDPILSPSAGEAWDYPFGESEPVVLPPSGRAAVLKPVLTCPG